MSSTEFLLEQNQELREQRAALTEENARLRAALKAAAVRLEILTGRMRGCHEETGKHELLDEAEAFCLEAREALSLIDHKSINGDNKCTAPPYSDLSQPVSINCGVSDTNDLDTTPKESRVKEIKNHCEELYKLCAKIAGILEVCRKCGYTWASWEETHDVCAERTPSRDE